MATSEEIKASAHRAGHTRRIIVEADAQDLYGYVKPDYDPDGEFTLIDDEDGTIFNVKGWNVEIHEIDD